MTDFIEIHWTSGSIEEARKISRYLVQERLVACARIIPWVESISLLNGQLDTTQESKVSLVASKDQYEKVQKIIRENSTYQVPEITYQAIDGVNEEYLHWLNSTQPSLE